MAANKPKKKQILRNNEYYGTQEVFDDLYRRSQDGECFTHLMELIADVDIKGFFDNVNHGKLLKQLWTLGIRDKQLFLHFAANHETPNTGAKHRTE